MAIYQKATCPQCRNEQKISEESRSIQCIKCGARLTLEPGWYIDYYASGRRKREKVPSKKLAEIVLQKRKVEIAEGKFLDIRKQERIRFEDFSDTFLNLHSKPNKKSWKSDEYNFIALRPYFRGRYLYDITTEDIEKYKAARAKEVAPATVNRELATLKTMFTKAIAWGKLKDHPAQTVKFLREPNGRLRFLEKEEIVNLLAKCKGIIKPIVIVALNTGMRRAEILNLKWRDIDFNRGIIYLLDTKNGERREVPMNAWAKSTIIRIRTHPESPYIFCNTSGRPYVNIRKSFLKAVTDSGILNFHFHDLRHTFASHLVMSGVDINTTRELLGHKDIRMTLRYSHLSQDHKKRAVDVLGSRMDTIWTPAPVSSETSKKEFSQPIAIEAG